MNRRYVVTYSIRSLLLIFLIVSVALQIGLTVRRQARERRVEQFSTDVYAMVVYSQGIPRENALRVLDLIDRRIVSFAEEQPMSRHRQRQLRQTVEAERAKIRHQPHQTISR
jgi:hypothetical protein